MGNKCLFAGSFDPFTVGHEAVVSAALELFSEVIVAVMVNPDKSCLFTEEERLSFLKALYRGEPRVTVLSYHGLVADLVKERGVEYVIRGVRNGTDYDYETVNYYATKRMVPDLKAVYVPADQAQTAVSSSVVRTLLLNGKDCAEYLPASMRESVLAALRRRGVSLKGE